VSSKTQDLLAFVRQLPVGMAYTPIYEKGVVTPSGKVSEGKAAPVDGHGTIDMNGADVALQIERQPQTSSKPLVCGQARVATDL
jgi:hypothetical protein